MNMEKSHVITYLRVPVIHLGEFAKTELTLVTRRPEKACDWCLEAAFPSHSLQPYP